MSPKIQGTGEGFHSLVHNRVQAKWGTREGTRVQREVCTQGRGYPGYTREVGQMRKNPTNCWSPLDTGAQVLSADSLIRCGFVFIVFYFLLKCQGGALLKCK